MLSGTGAIAISTDATATTINIGTGGGVKTVAVGSVNTTSALTLNSGTGGITATGVFGVVSGGAVPVVINAAGLLGTVVSSKRFKHDIKDIPYASSSVLDLRPVTFVYNGDLEERKQYGLIAEEVEEILPDLVVRNEDGEIETVQYHILPVLLLNEIKKLNERIAILESRP
jgi:hypothetical protein